MQSLAKMYKKSMAQGASPFVEQSLSIQHHGWVTIPLDLGNNSHSSADSNDCNINNTAKGFSQTLRVQDRASMLSIAERVCHNKKSSYGERATLSINRLGIRISSSEVSEDEALIFNSDEDSDDDPDGTLAALIDADNASNPIQVTFNAPFSSTYDHPNGRNLLKAEPTAIVCILLCKEKGFAAIMSHSVDENGADCLGCDVLRFQSKRDSVSFITSYKNLTTEFDSYISANDDNRYASHTSLASSSSSSNDSPQSSPRSSPKPLRRQRSSSESADHGTSASDLLTRSGNLRPLLATNQHNRHLQVDHHHQLMKPPSTPPSASSSPRGSPRLSLKGSPKSSPKPSPKWSRLVPRSMRKSNSLQPQSVLTGMASVKVKRADTVDLSEANHGYLRTETVSRILESETGAHDTYLVCNAETSQRIPCGFLAVEI